MLVLSIHQARKGDEVSLSTSSKLGAYCYIHLNGDRDNYRSPLPVQQFARDVTFNRRRFSHYERFIVADSVI